MNNIKVSKKVRGMTTLFDMMMIFHLLGLPVLNPLAFLLFQFAFRILLPFSMTTLIISRFGDFDPQISDFPKLQS